MGFHEIIRRYRWEEIGREIANRTPSDVERALAARSLGLDGLMGLLSPAAEPFLEEIAQRAHRLTVQRFGRVMGFFAPLYLSNVCTNRCVYCGFNTGNRIARLTLTPEEAGIEGKSIRRLGIRHVLLLAGEDPLELLRRVRHRVVTMHASDRYLAEGTLEDLRREETSVGYARRLRHGEIGKGLSDYDAIFTLLRDAGFDGWISIEDGVEGLDQLKRSADFLRQKIRSYWPEG